MADKRTTDAVRRDIDVERAELASAVDSLRKRVTRMLPVALGALAVPAVVRRLLRNRD